MPRISDLFPSKYLRAADLQKPGIRLPVNVRIARVTQEELGGDDRAKEIKPVVYFHGKEKGLVVNRTNGDELAVLLGEETDDWPGRVVGLTVQRVRMRNDMVWGLRIVAAVRPEQQQQQNARQHPVQRATAAAAAAAPARAPRVAAPEPEPDPDFTDEPGYHEPADNTRDRFDDDIPF